MEASPAAMPEKALAIVVTKQMLYGEETPLVGVGLMYKPHYISTEAFSAAYMHLHVWHMAGSHVESEDKLNSSQLLFINLSEKWCATCGGATPHLIGCGHERGDDQDW